MSGRLITINVEIEIHTTDPALCGPCKHLEFIEHLQKDRCRMFGIDLVPDSTDPDYSLRTLSCHKAEFDALNQGSTEGTGNG